MFHDPACSSPRPVRAAHRLFFALRPSPPLARQLANAAVWFHSGGRAVAADRLHITMFIPDDFAIYPTAVVAGLLAVGAAVAAGPIEIVLDYVSGGGRSIALRPQHRNPALTTLYQELAALCRQHGIVERADYSWQPHVTLGYRDGRPFGERVPPVSWTATELVLIHSHLGHTKHDIIGRWPLVAKEPDQGSLF